MEKLIDILDKNKVAYCVKFIDNAVILTIRFKDGSSISLIEKDKCEFLNK